MMKRARVALLTLFAAGLVALPATAAPPGQGLEQFEVTCNGQSVTVTVSGGSSFWVGEQHYVILSFTGTFVPEEGEPETFTQTFGQKKGLKGAEITCTATFVEPGEGSFAVEVTAAAVPPRS